MKKVIIFLTFGFCVSLTKSYSQWTTSGNNLYNSNSGNVGIGTTTPGYKLQVSGGSEIGDSHDPSQYGFLQLTRPANQGDNKFHLSFIRNSNAVFGMGFGPNNNVVGLWYANNNAATPSLAFEPGGTVGIGLTDPSFGNQVASKLSIAQQDGYSGLTIGNGTTPRFAINGQANGSWVMCDHASGSWTQGLAQVSGNVGIGTATPSMLLEVRKDQNDVTRIGVENFSSGSNAESRLDLSTATPNSYVISSIHDNGGSPYYILSMGSAVTSSYFDAPEFNLRNPSGVTYMKISNTGNIGIGTTNPQAKLAVNGDIFSKKIKVTQTGWSDYVFEDGYTLLPLTEVEKYIQKFKHLPDVPSVLEIQNEGLDIGDNQATLLKKIEELTLYIIQLSKEINAQQQKINQLEKTNQR